MGLKNNLLRYLLNRISTHRLGASDLSIAAVFGNQFKEKALVINNAVDLDEYLFNNHIRNSIRGENNIQPDELVLGFVGRLSHQKNVFYLISIFHECVKRIPKVKLLIVGEGELYEVMKNDLEEKGILDLVHFLGIRDNVNELMWAMDILLLPSFYEGLPLVLVESQSASLMSLVSTKITQLVNLTPFIAYLDIEDKDLNFWVDRIIDYGNNYLRDSSVKQLLTDKNFNIQVEAERLSKIYLQNN